MTPSIAEGSSVLGSKVEGMIQDLFRMRQEKEDLEKKIHETEQQVRNVLADVKIRAGV